MKGARSIDEESAFEKLVRKYHLNTEKGMKDWIKLVVRKACERMDLEPVEVGFTDVGGEYGRGKNFVFDYEELKIKVDERPIQASVFHITGELPSSLKKLKLKKPITVPKSFQAAIFGVLRGLYHELHHYRTYLEGEEPEAFEWEWEPLPPEEKNAERFAEKEWWRFFDKLVTEGGDERK